MDLTAHSLTKLNCIRAASVSREDVNSVSSLRRDFLFGGKKTMLSGKLMPQWNPEPSISE